MSPNPVPPIVVVGGSAGALRPLQHILSELPANLPAAVCVVIHMPDDSPSALARLLAHAGPLDAEFADDSQPLHPGRVVVAPPGNHLLVHDGNLELSQGARENGLRPAIDPLFRSAARAAGPDVVSVLLSGTLDDGAAGTAIVRAAGGVTIVQDPAEADFPDMPRNAIATGEVAAVLPVAAIAAAIRAAVESMAHRRSAPGHDDRDGQVPYEEPVTVALGEPVTVAAGDRPAGDPGGDTVDRGLHGRAPDLEGTASPYSCPACGGVLFERTPPSQYLCRLGHRYSPDSLRSGQEAVIEDALWTALRTLEEAASLATRVRDRATARGDRAMELRFEARRLGAQERADRIRGLLEGERVEDEEAVADEDEQRSA